MVVVREICVLDNIELKTLKQQQQKQKTHGHLKLFFYCNTLLLFVKQQSELNFDSSKEFLNFFQIWKSSIEKFEMISLFSMKCRRNK